MIAEVTPTAIPVSTRPPTSSGYAVAAAVTAVPSAAIPPAPISAIRRPMPSAAGPATRQPSSAPATSPLTTIAACTLLRPRSAVKNAIASLLTAIA